MRPLDPDQVKALNQYAAGRLTTRAVLDRADLHDYADLLVELSQRDLRLPRPAESRARTRNVAAASAILQPLLRRGA